MIIFSRLKNFIYKISSGVSKKIGGKKKIFAMVLSLILIGLIFVIPQIIFAQDGATPATPPPAGVSGGGGGVSGGGVGGAAGGGGAGGSTGLEGVVADFLIAIFRIFLYVGGNLLLFMTKALIAFCSYNDFANSTAVISGWVIVRDLVNMFFVVVLLVIAIATILKIESYSYKKMLGRLVLMAVLVNFSKTISLLFIDFAQVVMMTFVNGFQAAGGGNFVTALGLTEILAVRNTATAAELSSFTTAGAYLLGLIMIIISTVVVGMMLVILVMRMIVLWILIVLSPLAFFLSIIPQAKKYADQWWSMFTEYVLVGPILAFFLWLSLVSVTSLSETDKPRFEEDTPETQQDVGISAIGSQDNLISFAIAIGMLVGGLTMTGKMGVIGAGIGVGVLAGAKRMGMGAARSAGKVGKWGGKKAFNYAGRKYNERGLPNPVAFFRAWGQRSEEKNKQAKEDATARSRGYVDYLASKKFLGIGGTGVRLPHEDMIKRKREAEHTKEWSHMQEKQKAKILEQLWGKTDHESVDMRRSLMTAMAAEGHLDDALETDFFRKELDVDKIDKKAIDKLLKAGCGTDQQGLRAIYDIGELGKKIGHFEYVGASDIDSDGKWKENDENSSKTRAWAEISKVKSRDQLSVAPHNFGVKSWDESANGGKGDWQWSMDTEDEESFENMNWDNRFVTKESQEIIRYSQDRATNLVGYNMVSGEFDVNEGNKEGIKKRWETGRVAVEALEEKAGKKGVNYNGKHFDSFRIFMHDPNGANLPKTDEEIKEEEEERKAKEKKERAEATEKRKAEREEASQKEERVGKIDVVVSSGGGARTSEDKEEMNNIRMEIEKRKETKGRREQVDKRLDENIKRKKKISSSERYNELYEKVIIKGEELNEEEQQQMDAFDREDEEILKESIALHKERDELMDSNEINDAIKGLEKNLKMTMEGKDKTLKDRQRKEVMVAKLQGSIKKLQERLKKK
ncbi:hypothetical protein A2316_01820 [Candidatus Falkowbacteria bacterium RIFOXYB2_FULL_38_15]|uniref:Uncharacterized protein n=1 Tax=Candidatus Falkowbacteria bacterium RIFOXYA2_FULL_38_12 TaxID=1797993 RepID=A0A1F5S2A8_9BACT|nr:MAG: hypothetical protein A2257_03600 [Candidatus Falkowbacteria bacterium RIFOXYA2_FULL_38_12]OGF32689.1 MAG: hypothetical protein A2316_01820 [Candidatus Falkowbacteria bacterium RIFOXYB2_FULL_38_15]OGF42093.1 MAG: hypothetical protein A2555_01715 [Candidatus Falkowbacteria bacterium RIFOXYD2_FULL_39_16]